MNPAVPSAGLSVRGQDNPFLPSRTAAPSASPVAAAMPRPHQEVSAARKIHALLRGRYWLTGTLCAAGLLAGALAGFKSQKPVFQSKGLIELRPVVQSVNKGERLMLLAQSYLSNQLQQIQGPRVIEAALTSAEWRTTGRGATNDAQAEFMRSLDVEIIPGSTVLQVTFEDKDPTVARAAVQAVINAYRATFRENNLTENSQKLQALTTTKTAKMSDIATKREQILAAAQQYGTENLTALQDAKLQRQVQLESDWAEARMSLSAMENSLKPANAVPMAPEEIATVDASVGAMLTATREADMRYHKALSPMGPRNPATVAAEQDYRIWSGQLDDAVAKFRSRYVAIKVDPTTGKPTPISQDTVQQLKDRASFLQSQLENLKDETASIGKRKLQILALNNDISKLEDEVSLLNRNIEDLQAETMTGGDLAVVSGGDLPALPYKDNRKKMAAVGGIAGGLLPVGILLLIGLLDSRYRFSDDHGEHMPHVPLLGILPHLPNLSTDPQQATVAAHCVHQIRTMLEIAANTQGRRAFAITSPSPTDGKTSLSLALGLSFAAAGTKTLLIDCDVIGGGLSARMKKTHPVGTLEAVAARQLEPYVQVTEVENLSILPVGTHSQHHPTILSPHVVQRLINDAKAQYDIVLIDTGPVLGSVEASPVCAAADGTVLVVSRGRQRGQVTRALDHLMSIGARMAGVVFNRATNPDFERSMSRLALRGVESSRPNQGAVMAGYSGGAA